MRRELWAGRAAGSKGFGFRFESWVVDVRTEHPNELRQVGLSGGTSARWTLPPTSGSRPGRGFQTTRRDLEIVRWFGRAGAATAAQVGARWPSMPESNVYRRLRGLVKLG